MKINFRKIPDVYVPFIVLFVALVILMPKAPKFNYDYRKGLPWHHETLISQFDFPILKTGEQMEEEREKAGSSIVPYYRYSSEVVNNSIRAVETMDLGRHNGMKSGILSRLNSLYTRGIISDAKVRLGRHSAAVSDEVLFVQKNKKAEKHPVSEVYKLSSARNKLMADLSLAYPNVNADSLLNKSGIYDIIVPNLIFDRSTTELVHAESADYISPTSGYVSADQKIISRGEIVTAEIAQILDSYKVEYEKNLGYDGPRIVLWIGVLIISLLLVCIVMYSINFFNPDIFADRNRMLYILTVFLLFFALTTVISKLQPGAVYLVPYSLVTLYLTAFFQRKVVVAFYMVCLMPVLLILNNGYQIFIMNLAAGMVCMYVAPRYNRGWKQFIISLIVFVVMTVAYSGFRLMDASAPDYLMTVFYIFIGSLLMVAFYPLIYLFEKIFNLVSQTRLVELCDTNSRLLRELSQKAPGTFQHSLQVMSMASACAREIGANDALTRAGALYHDIGKMKNPLCFVENESTTITSRKYHDGLDSKQSARDIISHVPDGLEIAEKHGLPSVIREFIATHHGSSTTGFFYTKYVNEGGDPADSEDFTYKWGRPSTREQAIVMLCDSIEAASRSIKDGTKEAYDKLVDDIIAAKIRDGQFNECDISMRETSKIQDVLKSFLAQMYHERVVYPDRN